MNTPEEIQCVKICVNFLDVRSLDIDVEPGKPMSEFKASIEEEIALSWKKEIVSLATASSKALPLDGSSCIQSLGLRSGDVLTAVLGASYARSDTSQ